MNKSIILLLFLVFLIGPKTIVSQNKKPKVALVLSGGGAKGLAHIPTLQALDSLGIVPDLIVGTSMGSVVGGLYAMGYSGDSIAILANNINWSHVLGGKTSLSDVSVEEKDQFKKYIADIDLVKGRPKINSSVLNDQNLRQLLTTLTYPVYNITDFDDLSIPYRAMTTDIVNGNELVLSSGSLAMAMRASMSIPGVFKPVPHENTLLVDGGIVNNFPVDIALELGADIIIGSDVGGGMASKEKLDNILTLLFQSSMLISNIKNPESQEKCDILIDHYPKLTYSTADFEKGKQIYEEGKIATNENLDKLVELKNLLNGFDQRTHRIPKTPEFIVLDTVIFSGISDGNTNFVKARTNLNSNETYSYRDLEQGINRAMGTTLFSQVTTNGFEHKDKIGLELIVSEHSKHQLKGSLHFDNYRGIGLIANYTGRNILGNASRFFVSLDIAEQPKIRVQYQKNFGQHKNWWWRSDALFEKLKQKVFIDGEVADEMHYRYFSFDNQINKNLNSFNSFIGLGINYEFTEVTPIVDPEIKDNILSLKNYDFNNLELYLQYIYNTMNNSFYPTKGNSFKGSISRAFFSKIDLQYNDPNKVDLFGETNGYTKMNLEFQKRIPISSRTTGIIGANTHYIFDDNIKSTEHPFISNGYAQRYFLGGNLENQRKNSYMFPGLHEDELNVSQIMKLNLGMQFNALNKIYVIPHFNVAYIGSGTFKDYFEGNLNSTLISAGTSFSYDSFMGPVNFDISWINDINKVRIFFSVGLMLN